MYLSHIDVSLSLSPVVPFSKKKFFFFFKKKDPSRCQTALYGIHMLISLCLHIRIPLLDLQFQAGREEGLSVLYL